MKSYNCKTLVFWMSHETNVKMDYLLRIMVANIIINRFYINTTKYLFCCVQENTIN